jgi:hypothetical protein
MEVPRPGVEPILSVCCSASSTEYLVKVCDTISVIFSSALGTFPDTRQSTWPDKQLSVDHSRVARRAAAEPPGAFAVVRNGNVHFADPPSYPLFGHSRRRLAVRDRRIGVPGRGNPL